MGRLIPALVLLGACTVEIDTPDVTPCLAGCDTVLQACLEPPEGHKYLLPDEYAECVEDAFGCAKSCFAEAEK